MDDRRPARPAPMLEVSHLNKQYLTPRGPIPVLSDISLSLSRGDAAAIMGPSGSGKSTLLYILGALDAPTSGSVTLDGRNPFELAEKELAAFRNKEIGFVFQDHCLLPQCSVLENVLIPTLVAESRDGYRDRAGPDPRAAASALRRTHGQPGSRFGRHRGFHAARVASCAAHHLDCGHAQS